MGVFSNHLKRESRLFDWRLGLGYPVPRLVFHGNHACCTDGLVWYTCILWPAQYPGTLSTRITLVWLTAWLGIPVACDLPSTQTRYPRESPLFDWRLGLVYLWSVTGPGLKWLHPTLQYESVCKIFCKNYTLYPGTLSKRITLVWLTALWSVTGPVPRYVIHENHACLTDGSVWNTCGLWPAQDGGDNIPHGHLPALLLLVANIENISLPTTHLSTVRYIKTFVKYVKKF
jgi:hypothetical protein